MVQRVRFPPALTWVASRIPCPWKSSFPASQSGVVNVKVSVLAASICHCSASISITATSVTVTIANPFAESCGVAWVRFRVIASGVKLGEEKAN